MNISQFNKLSSQEKWDKWKKILNVKWVCGECGVTMDNPERMSAFDGNRSSRHCCKCDGILTIRTGGGQCDPFNWKAKRRKK